jgi:hypothetical protein
MITRRLSLVFGLLIGLMWMLEILFGNLGDTSVLGNVRTFHFHAYRIVGWTLIWGALAFTMLSGLYTAYRTGNTLTARKVAVWSGLISGAMALVTMLAMTTLFLDALRQSPSDLAEFARGHEQSFSQFIYLEALAGGLNHLWIGPLLGAVLGSVGAAAGKRFRGKPLNP